jgi:hypothetical protein
MSSLPIDQIVGLYLEAAAETGRYEDTSSEKVNRAADVVAAAYRELRRRGIDAQRVLLALLDHPDLAVRGWAGAHALEFAPEQGEQTLEELSQEPTIRGFNAEMTLEVWRKGELRFP